MSENQKQARVKKIVIAYPFVLATAVAALNYFIFGVAPLTFAPPAAAVIGAIVFAFALLLINHSWLMTSTELIRLRYDLRATPEEWRESGLDPARASAQGLAELQRRHNAHRNTTENVVYFLPLALLFAFVSPPFAASLAWIVGFGVARLGYTYAYFAANTSLRGAFMTLSLLCNFGLASYLAIAWIRSI
ncbi:MAG: MAPEG family protein [bacterium]|nr:MAPEG family protein [bacterium]